jgi:hypothetical protein
VVDKIAMPTTNNICLTSPAIVVAQLATRCLVNRHIKVVILGFGRCELAPDLQARESYFLSNKAVDFFHERSHHVIMVRV